MRSRALVILLLTIELLLTAACDDRTLKPTSVCRAGRSTKILKYGRPAKVDLLVVVDDSASMAEEQQHLREQFPRLIRALMTGRRSDRDPDPFTPLQDLHVGVVSTDLGLPDVGATAAGCRADGGDAARLQHAGRAPGCQTDYPEFLHYIDDDMLGPSTNKAQFERDVSCLGALGSAGCGYEQPLEAALLALQGANPGFLRNDEYDGLSLVAILLVTDEDDCSLQSTDQLTSASTDPDCVAHKARLHDLAQRYYEGFRKLRPGREPCPGISKTPAPSCARSSR